LLVIEIVLVACAEENIQMWCQITKQDIISSDQTKSIEISRVVFYLHDLLWNSAVVSPSPGEISCSVP